MPICSQGNIFDLAPKADLTVIFGHISFNDLGGTWLEFKRSHPEWEHIHDPFQAFQNKPQTISKGHWIWFVPDECNGGMSCERVVEVFDAITDWATEMKLRQILTNGIRSIDNEPDYLMAQANRSSDDHRAQFLVSLSRSYETAKKLKVTLISLTDIFVRIAPQYKLQAVI